MEALKKSSMKIGEAMYKNAGDGGAGGDGAEGTQSADYENVKKDEEKK